MLAASGKNSQLYDCRLPIADCQLPISCGQYHQAVAGGPAAILIGNRQSAIQEATRYRVVVLTQLIGNRGRRKRVDAEDASNVSINVISPLPLLAIAFRLSARR